ncbi:MAG TPA: class I SAM-dependent methyltransferase [Ignavibacteriaceae bacterium]|nr:class I SAM-dependent methyltransferase [Ignavibacteriaceae bacterium]
MDQYTDDRNSILKIYSQRKNKESLYNYLNPQVYLSNQERERYLIKWLKYAKINPGNSKLFEFGCGSGFNFLTFLKLGFNAKNLYGNDLIEERVAKAKEILPSSINLYVNDLLLLDLPKNYYDIFFQSVVFSSILNSNYKKELADKMWELVKPGGGILWYDFIFDNPQNNNVKGIKLNEIKMLFPYGRIKRWKLTVAPPLGRLVTKIQPSFYSVFNIFPFFKTHILCWIKKT